MTDTSVEADQATGVVRVSRRIRAPAAAIFAVVADPARHLDLDGSGMVRGAVTDHPMSGVGDFFVMRMYYVEHGDYQMRNHVVEFERDVRLVWEPESWIGHPDHGRHDARWGQRWGYELEPDGPQATLVTEIYDCSRVPEADRADMQGGRIWIDAMIDTLARLDAVVTGAATVN
jgi:hypothetical protein